MKRWISYTMLAGLGGILIAPLGVVNAQEDVRRAAPQKEVRVIPLPPPPKKALPTVVSKPRVIAGPKLTIKVPTEKLDLPEMITLPGEVFTMGDYEGQPDETPAHQVQLINFEISKYPISNKQFRQFVESTNYKTEAERNPTALEQAQKISWRTFAEGREHYPVVWVSANDANAFCRWLTLVITANKGQVIDETAAEKEGALQGGILRIYRLPTEAEWEYAARGSLESVAYPWGDVADREKLNCNWDNRPDTVEAALKYLKPVGHQPANKLQLRDMVGNVAQWCLDYYDANFYQRGAESAYAPYGPEDGSAQVVRGGSWQDAPENCRVFSRHSLAPQVRNAQTGFRVARTGERTLELNSDTSEEE